MEEVQYKLLKALEENSHLSQRELAQKAGISLGKANYCLRALIHQGWVKVNRFTRSENRAAYVYLLTASGVEEKVRATAHFLRRKISEYEALENEIAQLRLEVRQDDQFELKRHTQSKMPFAVVEHNKDIPGVQ